MNLNTTLTKMNFNTIIRRLFYINTRLEKYLVDYKTATTNLDILKSKIEKEKLNQVKEKEALMQFLQSDEQTPTKDEVKQVS